MYRVGIDLGGTNIAVGVVNEDYEIISYTTVPTEARRPAEQVIADAWVAGEIAANIQNGADPTTVESVLRILKLC